MLRPIKWLRARVPLRTWAWIHAFLALGIGWGHAISIYPPTTYQGNVDLTLVIRMGVITGIGSIVAVWGMLMTRAINVRTQHKGFWTELVGTILVGGGPLQYLGIQLGFIFENFQTEFNLRYALAWFMYSMGAFICVRFAIVIPALMEARRLVRFEDEVVNYGN